MCPARTKEWTPRRSSARIKNRSRHTPALRGTASRRQGLVLCPRHDVPYTRERKRALLKAGPHETRAHLPVHRCRGFPGRCSPSNGGISGATAGFDARQAELAHNEKRRSPFEAALHVVAASAVLSRASQSRARRAPTSKWAVIRSGEHLARPQEPRSKNFTPSASDSAPLKILALFWS